jgi:tetratricopeptide (TPR) repeat protein
MALSRALPLVTAIVLVVPFQNRVAQAQPADPQQLCEGPQSMTEDRVKGCSAIIDAGQARGPELAAAYAQRGFAFTLKRNIDQAKNDLDQAIKIAPDYAQAYVNRANLWTVANQPERAMADAETALRLDPNLPLAFFVSPLRLTARRSVSSRTTPWPTAIVATLWATKKTTSTPSLTLIWRSKSIRNMQRRSTIAPMLNSLPATNQARLPTIARR